MRMNSGTESLSLIIIVSGKPGNKTTKHRKDWEREGKHKTTRKKEKKKTLHKQKQPRGKRILKENESKRKKRKKGIYVSVRCLWYFEFLRTSPVVCSVERGFAPADRQSLNGANHRFSALSALPPLRAWWLRQPASGYDRLMRAPESECRSPELGTSCGATPSPSPPHPLPSPLRRCAALPRPHPPLTRMREYNY